GDGGAGGEADDELARNAGLGALGEGGGDGEEEEGGDQAAADADGMGHDVQGVGGVVGREARSEKALRSEPLWERASAQAGVGHGGLEFRPLVSESSTPEGILRAVPARARRGRGARTRRGPPCSPQEPTSPP